MPDSILPKTNSFKVLCVFIANYGVNNEKSEIHGLTGVLKMLTMEKSKKPKLTISVRQLLFIIDLYYSTLDWYNPLSIKHQCWCSLFFFVCLFVFLRWHNTIQNNEMIGPQKRAKNWNRNFHVSDFNCQLFMIFAFQYMDMLLGVRNLDKFVFT